MDILKQEIEILKNKIKIEIESFAYHSDTKHIKDTLLEELNSKEYDENDELSVKEYYAWLKSFYEVKIASINQAIINDKNGNIFDNSTEEQLEKISLLKKEIEEDLNYITTNYPEFNESTIKLYNEINEYYEEAYNIVVDNCKNKFNLEVGVKDDSTEKIRNILSVFKDAYSVRESYIAKLEVFNASCDSIKIFNEKDKKIKEILAKAYKVIDDEETIKVIKEIENNYDTGIRQSVKDELLISGPDKIQKKMEESCGMIEDMTNSEIKRDYYLREIKNMTLNIDVKKLMDIKEYVDNNDFLKDLFYNNLYILVEKEKFLVRKYHDIRRIYPLLDEKTILGLEEKFLKRLEFLSEEEASNVVTELKRNGYSNTLDKKYLEFFENQEFTNNQEVYSEDTKYSLRHLSEFHEDSSHTYWAEFAFSDVEGAHVRKIWPIFRKFKHLHNVDTYGKNFAFIDYEGMLRRKFAVVDFKTGKIVIVPRKIKGWRVDCQLGYYLRWYRKTDKDCWTITITTPDFEIVRVLHDVVEYRVDNIKKQLIVCDKYYKVSIYDQNLDLVKTINMNYDFNLIEANDGVTSVKTDKDIMFCDTLTFDVIDSCKKSNEMGTSLHAYSEGLYNYVDKNGLVGYKNLNKDIVIEPKYLKAGPFLDNIAKAVIIEKQEKIADERITDEHGEIKNISKKVMADVKVNGVIDRTGKFTSLIDVYKEIYDKKMEEIEKYKSSNRGRYNWDYYYFFDVCSYSTMIPSLKTNFKDGRYEVWHGGWDEVVGYIHTSNNYLVNIDTPIKDIDFDVEKGIRKVKSNLIQ